MKLSAIARTTMLASLLVGGLLGVGRADEPTNGDHPHHRRPPQAAFDACQSKKAGDACQVALPDRTLSGVCNATSDGALACRPDHPPGPPPEMTQACSGKADGDACTFTHGDRSESGICRKGRAGTLICLP